MPEFFNTDLGFGWSLWELALFIGIILSALIAAYFTPRKQK